MTDLRLAILDLDGTVYRGSEPIPGVAETIESLLSRGIAVRYLTNNSAARPVAVTEKLRAMGVTCEPDWVYGAGMAAARECRRRGVESVFLVGEPGLDETFADFRPGGDAVVVGICRRFSYELMSTSMQLIRDGALFIATNRDATYPREFGRFEPGAGAMVAAIETCSGVEPIVIGKPEPRMILDVMAEAGAASAETLVVGDRLDTDIAAGENAGCRTWLVLTGVETALPQGQPGSADLAGLLDAFD